MGVKVQRLKLIKILSYLSQGVTVNTKKCHTITKETVLNVMYY